MLKRVSAVLPRSIKPLLQEILELRLALGRVSGRSGTPPCNPPCCPESSHDVLVSLRLPSLPALLPPRANFANLRGILDPAELSGINMLNLISMTVDERKRVEVLSRRLPRSIGLFDPRNLFSRCVFPVLLHSILNSLLHTYSIPFCRQEPSDRSVSSTLSQPVLIMVVTYLRREFQCQHFLSRNISSRNHFWQVYTFQFNSHWIKQKPMCRLNLGNIMDSTAGDDCWSLFPITRSSQPKRKGDWRGWFRADLPFFRGDMTLRLRRLQARALRATSPRRALAAARRARHLTLFRRAECRRFQEHWGHINMDDSDCGTPLRVTRLSPTVSPHRHFGIRSHGGSWNSVVCETVNRKDSPDHGPQTLHLTFQVYNSSLSSRDISGLPMDEGNGKNPILTRATTFHNLASRDNHSHVRNELAGLEQIKRSDERQRPPLSGVRQGREARLSTVPLLCVYCGRMEKVAPPFTSSVYGPDLTSLDRCSDCDYNGFPINEMLAVCVSVDGRGGRPFVHPTTTALT
ncbi:hypothetical protein J6590_054538 [Homalodisca vitripennis]|nr:hypothetical protein J6590_054538 [Homalodisca vitripennis]